MKCHVPKCNKPAEREICRPHWRRVPGALKALIRNADENNDRALYDEWIKKAVQSVTGVRNV